MVWTEPAIRLVFERGAFDARSTQLVSTAFFYLCISIIPYIFRDTLTRVFYSLGDSKTPLYVAIFAIFVKVILNYLLVDNYALAGIAMATVLMTTINFIVLSGLLYLKLSRKAV
jgi:putative peptidoglycan lipid II flippase